MERWSASTRQWNESGRRACATGTAPLETEPCHTGSTTTTRAGPTQPSTANPPLPALTTSPGTTTRCTPQQSLCKCSVGPLSKRLRTYSKGCKFQPARHVRTSWRSSRWLRPQRGMNARPERDRSRRHNRHDDRNNRNWHSNHCGYGTHLCPIRAVLARGPSRRPMSNSREPITPLGRRLRRDEPKVFQREAN
jgi:hypothetical protein